MQHDELLQRLAALRRRFFRPRVKQSFVLEIAPRASEETLVETEQRLGFGLPPLLRRIYAEIGNGGFGPGYGLIGAIGGAVDDRGDTIVEAYLGRAAPDPSEPSWVWPAKVVPLFSWGGAVYTCGDLSDTTCPLVLFDPQLYRPGAALTGAFKAHQMTLSVFLGRWISGDNVMAEAALRVSL